MVLSFVRLVSYYKSVYVYFIRKSSRTDSHPELKLYIYHFITETSNSKSTKPLKLFNIYHYYWRYKKKPFLRPRDIIIIIFRQTYPLPHSFIAFGTGARGHGTRGSIYNKTKNREHLRRDKKKTGPPGNHSEKHNLSFQ